MPPERLFSLRYLFASIKYKNNQLFMRLKRNKDADVRIFREDFVEIVFEPFLTSREGRSPHSVVAIAV